MTFNELPPIDVNSQLVADAAFQQKKRLVITGLKRLLKRSLRRLTELQSIYHNYLQWAAVHHEGLLLQANQYRIHRGMAEITIADWEQEGQERAIPLDPLLDIQTQIAKRFKQAKKMHRGIEHAARQVALAQNNIDQCEHHLLVVADIATMQDLEQFCQRHGYDWHKDKTLPHRKQTEPPKPYHQFFSSTGVPIWVGKSAKDNDRLTFQCANGSDWWLHAHNYPGSHVVIRCAKGTEPDPETIQEAAELAIRYSKMKDKDEGEICLTQVKFLKRIKGAPGKVMLSKHKVLHIKSNEQRWHHLKNNRTAPPEQSPNLNSRIIG